MKAEQLIYTSCNRGVSGRTSGFQVYSQSPGMAAWLSQGNELGPLEYSTPRGPQYPDTPRTAEELAAYPSRSHFGPMAGPDGLYRMALATYIGRDYPEGVIRQGNYIDHALAVRTADMDAYPCQYIQSPTFWTTMDLGLARSEEPPRPMPQVEPRRNDITADTVQRFLGEGDHAHVFETMMRCFLNRRVAINGMEYTRRIVIRCDADEFAMWVAAIQMALPIRQSTGYGFSTYEAYVTRADADIVRAVDGMNESLAELTQSCAVFDLMSPDTPLPDPTVSGTDSPADPTLVSLTDDLCQFLVNTMQYAIESLNRFHRFLDETDYAGTDTQLGAAYALMTLIDGLTPFARMDVASVNAALAFLQRHCPPAMWRGVADSMFRELDSASFDAERLGIIANTLGGIAESDHDYAAKAAEHCLDMIFAVFSSAEPDRNVYEQRHTVAAEVFSALHRNLDAELFEQLADNPNVNLGLDAAAGTALPWTTDVMASWLAGAVVETARRQARGSDMLGQPLSTMAQAIGRRNVTVMDRIATAVIRHDGGSDASRLVDGMARALSPVPWTWFLFLLDVLSASADSRFVDSPRPTSQPSQAAAFCYALLRDWYLSQDDRTKRLCLCSLCSSGEYQRLTDLLLGEQARSANVQPTLFLDFLVSPDTANALPSTYRAEHAPQLLAIIDASVARDVRASVRYRGMAAANGLLGANVPKQWFDQSITALDAALPLDTPAGDETDQLRSHVERLCAQLGSPIPQRMQLIGYRRIVDSLAQACTAKHPDASTVDKLLRRIGESSRQLPLAAAGPDLNAYLAGIAHDVALCIPTSPSCRTLQALVVPADHVASIIDNVMRETASDARAENVVLLLAVDSGFVDGTQGLRFREDQLAGILARAIAQSGMRLKQIDHIVGDERRMDKTAARYERLYGITFPDEAFDRLVDGVSAVLADAEQQHKPSIFGSIRSVFGGKGR